MGADAKLYSTKQNMSCDVDRKHNLLVLDDCPDIWDDIYQYATGASPAVFMDLVKHQLSVLNDDDYNLNEYRLRLALMFLETLDDDDVVYLYDEHHKEEEYYWNWSGKIKEFGDRLPYDAVA